MSRYIDADELTEFYEPYKDYKDMKVPVNALLEQIKDTPTADVVEVVRCGECEYWKCNPNTDEYGVCKKVSYDDFEVVMDADDFCSYGEKKEQDNE